ncbi:hypothetical protein CEXT_387801 [Caerostris extrusa]|uniref:Uncharacterized protein n=1 Tax=Caerostris extrusa TaxID=172846 RepID=A0AAV4W7U2_CAEEX|nr:hypothetical protein CEXT_387801 [Caerostris extrusa]
MASGQDKIYLSISHYGGESSFVLELESEEKKIPAFHEWESCLFQLPLDDMLLQHFGWRLYMLALQDRFDISSSSICVLCEINTVRDASHLRESREGSGHLYNRHRHTRQKLQDLRSG